MLRDKILIEFNEYMIKMGFVLDGETFTKDGMNVTYKDKKLILSYKMQEKDGFNEALHNFSEIKCEYDINHDFWMNYERWTFGFIMDVAFVTNGIKILSGMKDVQYTVKQRTHHPITSKMEFLINNEISIIENPSRFGYCDMRFDENLPCTNGKIRHFQHSDYSCTCKYEDMLEYVLEMIEVVRIVKLKMKYTGRK